MKNLSEKCLVISSLFSSDPNSVIIKTARLPLVIKMSFVWWSIFFMTKKGIGL